MIPTAMVSEYAHVRRGGSSITFVTTGYQVGGVLTALVLIMGFFVFSAQVLLYAYVSKHCRIGAIGGPILGGMLLGAGFAVPWGFYAFAAVGLLGCVFIAAVPRSPAEVLRETPPTPEGAAR